MKLLTARRILAAAFASVLFTTCGLDEDYYLPSVPIGNVSMKDNTIATIRLPDIDDSSGGDYPFFRGFKLYYRIYMSNVYTTAEIKDDPNSTMSAQMDSINPTLQSNYRTIYPYTDVAGNTINTSLPSLLREDITNNDYRFYPVEFGSNGSIVSDRLSASAKNKTIHIDSSLAPQLIFHFGAPETERYDLLRARPTGEKGLFKPLPENRFFINDDELKSSENIKKEEMINAFDIVDISSDDTNIRNVYVAFYILVAGFNDTLIKPFYSAPTFVGVIRLQ